MRERPGLAPAALFHIIGHSLFLRLSDVAEGLPPYAEQVQLAKLDAEPNQHGLSQASAYHQLAKALKQALLQALADGSARLLSTYLQALLAYPEACARGETVFDPESGEQSPPKRSFPALEITVTRSQPASSSAGPSSWLTGRSNRRGRGSGLSPTDHPSSTGPWNASRRRDWPQPADNPAVDAGGCRDHHDSLPLHHMWALCSCPEPDAACFVRWLGLSPSLCARLGRLD